MIFIMRETPAIDFRFVWEKPVSIPPKVLYEIIVKVLTCVYMTSI